MLLFHLILMVVEANSSVRFQRYVSASFIISDASFSERQKKFQLAEKLIMRNE